MHCVSDLRFALQRQNTETANMESKLLLPLVLARQNMFPYYYATSPRQEAVAIPFGFVRKYDNKYIFTTWRVIWWFISLYDDFRYTLS